MRSKRIWLFLGRQTPVLLFPLLTTLLGCGGVGCGGGANGGAGSSGSGGGGGSGSAVPALNLTLGVTDRSGLTREQAPITGGIPFEKGKLFATDRLAVYDAAGRALPTQFRVTGRWADGSIRWLLVDFQANVRANRTVRFRLRTTSRPPKASHPIHTRWQGDSLVVDTGAARFELSRKNFRLFDRVVIGRRTIVSPSTRSGISITAANANHTTYTAAANGIDLRIVEAGPLRTVVEASGPHVAANGATLCRFTLRLHFFSEKTFVRGTYTIENPNRAIHRGNVWDLGSAGSRYLEDVALQLALPLETRSRRYRLKTESGVLSGRLLGGRTGIYQDSSGGARWNHDTHLNRHNRVSTSFRGYKAYENGQQTERGNRPQPYLEVYDDQRGCAVAVRQFWQTFPNALDYENEVLSIRPLPGDAAFEHELQGGEHCTKEILWLFHRGTRDVPSTAKQVADFMDPLIPVAEASVYAASRVAGRFPTPSARRSRWETWRRLWVEPQGSVQRTVVSQRETIDEYGWRNFGDFMADHETDCGRQSYDVPISHFNNEFDPNLGCLIEFLRSGDLRMFDLGAEGSRHLTNVDIYHAVDPPYGGGVFWHTTHDVNAYLSTHRSFPSAIQNLNCTRYKSGGPGLGNMYLDGLLLYYHLTGDERARQAALEVGEFMLAFAARTGGAHTAREAANTIRSAIALHRETSDMRFLTLAEDVVRDWAFPPRSAQVEFKFGMLGLALGRFVEYEREIGRGQHGTVTTALASLSTLADTFSTMQPSSNPSNVYMADSLVTALLLMPNHLNAAKWRDKAKAVWEAIFVSRAPTYPTLKPLTFMTTQGLLWPYYEDGGR